MDRLTLISLVFLISCGNIKNKTFLQEIDKGLDSLEKIKTEIIGIDTLSVRFRKNTMDSILYTIKENKPKKIAKEVGFLLSDYHKELKSSNKILKKVQEIQVGYTTAYNQLDNLKTDINNNLLSDEQIKEFIQSEMDALQTLKNISRQTIQWEKENEKIFKEKHQQLLNWMDSTLSPE